MVKGNRNCFLLRGEKPSDLLIINKSKPSDRWDLVCRQLYSRAAEVIE
jgi:hypothetical protein